MSETCPKCGAEYIADLFVKLHVGEWTCGSYWMKDGGILQTDACRIRALEAENARLRKLSLFTYHREHCALLSTAEAEACTCGLDDLFEPMKEEKRE